METDPEGMESAPVLPTPSALVALHSVPHVALRFHGEGRHYTEVRGTT